LAEDTLSMAIGETGEERASVTNNSHPLHSQVTPACETERT
jgi:hypothetical protein